MSLKESAIWYCQCDYPGCNEHYSTTENDAYMESLGWVIRYSGSVKKLFHYCPKHIRVWCSKCSATVLGKRNALITEGWLNITDDGSTLCPKCAKRGGKQ